MYLRVAARPLDTTTVVEIDDGFKGRHRTIMHVRRAMGDIAQRRRLERILQGYRARKQPAATYVVIMRGPDVVKRRIGKSPTGVTGGAIRFAVEEGEAVLGGFADRSIVAVEPTIEWRLAGDNRTLECRQRHLDFVYRDVSFAEGGVEGIEITGNRREAFGQRPIGEIHISGRGDCGDADSFQIAEVAVPSEFRRPSYVE